MNQRTSDRRSAACGARATKGLSALAVAALLCALSACDPPEPETALVPAPATFEVTSINLRGGLLADGEPLRVGFSAPLDGGSVRRATVTVRRENGRPLRRLNVWTEDDALFVAPAPGGRFPIDESLTLRVAGRPSPRSVRSAEGRTLARPAEVDFRLGPRRRRDLSGPRLIGSVPSDGERDWKPGPPIELHMSEPVARGSIRNGDAVRLLVDGEEAPARLRLSADHTVVLVRPRRPLPARAEVEVHVRRTLLDTAGNPARRGRARIRFRTSPQRLRKLVEEFVDAEYADPAGTTSAWGDPLSPGHLVARPGQVVWRSVDESGRRDDALASRSAWRFQLLVPADDDAAGVTATGLRLRLQGAADGAEVLRAQVLAGATDLLSLDPTFDGNLRAAKAVMVTQLDEARAAELDGDGAAFLALPFDVPVRLAGRAGLLVDVTLELSPGAFVAARRGPVGLALIEGHAVDDLVPLAEVLVSGGDPRARSTWFDSGVTHPSWGTAVVTPAATPGGVAAAVEFQSAAPGPDGQPDLSRTSAWESRLDDLPAFRFVRFRVRFDGLGVGRAAPRVDRVEMPFEY